MKSAVRLLAAPSLLILPLTGCGGPEPVDLADVMDSCALEASSWMPDDDGIVVGTAGVSPETEDQVQCVLDETGASNTLQKDFWVDTSTGNPQPRHVQEENGLRYSWSWGSYGPGVSLIITPTG